MNPRPTFEEWLVEQDYDKLLWEYKQVLKELLDKRNQKIKSVIKLRRTHDKLYLKIICFIIILFDWLLNFYLKVSGANNIKGVS